jgi:tRNA(fMet)-specific endonuclease VapC
MISHAGTKILVDSCSVIRSLENREYRNVLNKYEQYICSTIYIEVIQGAKTHQQLKEIEKDLSRYNFIDQSQDTFDVATDFIRKYSKSHNLMLADALIGATAAQTGFYLQTDNERDFEFITEIKLLEIL